MCNQTSEFVFGNLTSDGKMNKKINLSLLSTIVVNRLYNHFSKTHASCYSICLVCHVIQLCVSSIHMVLTN
jgi:hypothetical protein